jgi:hypothetical protein
MKYYINRDTVREAQYAIQLYSAFNARDIDIPQEVVCAINDIRLKHIVIQDYLDQCYELTPKAKLKGATVEIPTFLTKETGRATTKTNKPKTRSKDSGV